MKDLIQHQIEAWALENYRTKTFRNYGDERLALSRAEEEVFNISIEEWPRLLACYMAYEVTIGSCQHGLDTKTCRKFHEFRLSKDWLDAYYREDSFLEFGQEFGFSYRESAAVFWKQKFDDVRSAMIIYKDEEGRKTWKGRLGKAFKGLVVSLKKKE